MLDRVQTRVVEKEIENISEREAICQYLESLKEFRLPELFRGCFGDVDADGYQPMMEVEKKMLRTAANAIRNGAHLKTKNTGILEQVVENTMNAKVMAPSSSG